MKQVEHYRYKFGMEAHEINELFNEFEPDHNWFKPITTDSN